MKITIKGRHHKNYSFHVNYSLPRNRFWWFLSHHITQKMRSVAWRHENGCEGDSTMLTMTTLNTVVSSLVRIHAKSILMLMKCLSVARRISGISRLLYVAQHRARSLIRWPASKTMLNRWVNIKLTLEELIHVISAETQAPVVEKVDSAIQWIVQLVSWIVIH